MTVSVRITFFRFIRHRPCRATSFRYVQLEMSRLPLDQRAAVPDGFRPAGLRATSSATGAVLCWDCPPLLRAFRGDQRCAVASDGSGPTRGPGDPARPRFPRTGLLLAPSDS